MTTLLVFCAAGLTLAWLVAAQRQFVMHIARRFVRLPRLQQAFAIFAIGILTVCAQKSGTNGVSNAEILENGRRGEKIIELSNNRIIESVEAEASGSDDSRRAAENAEIGTVVPQAEEESLSNHNSIIRQFDYSIIDSNASASPSLLNLRVKAPQASTTFHSSQFWHTVQDDGSLLLTWQNALLNREATNPVSFQAELAPSGNVTYRYDFSNLASDDLLTNAVVAIGDLVIDGVTNRAVTSVKFQSEEDQRCDEARERFNEIIGDVDPFLYPTGSTNMVWEHVVYTGTTNAPFAYPVSSDDTAILCVTVSGSGTGELVVGERCVVLQGTGNKEQATGNKEQVR